MNQNLSSMIYKYGNRHTLNSFKGRTPFIPNDGESTPQSRKNSGGSKEDFSFSSAVKKDAKNRESKKRSTYQSFNYADEDESIKLAPIFATEQHSSEILYSDLLQRLMVFVINLSGFTRK